jgi:aspartyl protease
MSAQPQPFLIPHGHGGFSRRRDGLVSTAVAPSTLRRRIEDVIATVQRANEFDRAGPMLDVRIGYYGRFETVRGLVDTGAISCFVGRALALRLGLPDAGPAYVVGAMGEVDSRAYRAEFGVPATGYVFAGEMFAVDDGSGKGYSVILGSTFLRHYRLTYDGRDRSVTFEGAS